MIAAMFLLQAIASGGAERPDLVELSTIVEPYARCHFAREPQVKALQDEWSVAAKRQYAEPADKAAASRAEWLMKEMTILQSKIEEDCGYEQVQRRLRDRLQKLHPKMDNARAYWLARYTFNTLNNLNETLVTLKAGVFPPSSPPPSSLPDERDVR